MSRYVIFPPVEQVLEMQPRLGFAFDCEMPLEEQRVRILVPLRERDEIGQACAKRHIGLAGRARHFACHHFERERDRHVLYGDAKAFAFELMYATGKRLSFQHVIEREREQSFVEFGRCELQPKTENVRCIEHEPLQPVDIGRLCHGRRASILISRKRSER